MPDAAQHSNMYPVAFLLFTIAFRLSKRRRELPDISHCIGIFSVYDRQKHILFCCREVAESYNHKRPRTIVYIWDADGCWIQVLRRRRYKLIL